PSILTASASAASTSLLCNGNTTTITATAGGGVTPYQYSLNGGAYQGSSTFTVGAGTYVVTVKDANNCTQASNSLVITQPTALSASISAGTIACNGGTTTITAVASGGTVTYLYSLNGGSYQSGNTFTVSSGTYTVTVKDANLCMVTTNTLNITQPAAISSPTAGSNSPICSGSALNLTASTVIGATYSWTGPNGFSSSSQNPTISNASILASGIYSVTASNGGCSSAVSTVNVTVNQTPSITTQPVNAQIAQGASTSVSVVASGSGLTYQWQYAVTSVGPWNDVLNGTPLDVVYTNETSSTLNIAVGESAPPGNGNFYRCVVSNGNCSVISSSSQCTILVGNNSCAQAFEIQTDGVAISGSLNGAVTEICTGATNKDVWYYFTPTCTNNYTIFLSNLGDNKDIYVYQSPCPSSCSAALYSGVNTGTTNESITASFTNGITYYLRIVDAANTGGSFNLTVTGPSLPVVTLNPIDVTEPVGGSAVFTVASTNSNGVQWELSTNAGSTWANLSNGGSYAGVTTNSLTVSSITASMDQYFYRARFTNLTAGCASKYSRPVDLSVWSANSGIDQTVCNGNTVNLSSTTDGTIDTRLFFEDFEYVSNNDGTGILTNWQLGIDAPTGDNAAGIGNRWSVSSGGTGAYTPLSGARSLAVMGRYTNGSWWYNYG
ncbi:MAG: hypothetical protein ACK44B_01630, partial [Flavobacteriales bacterium]